MVLYLREGTYSAVNSRIYFRRRAIRLHIRYTLYGRRLRQGSRMVLHEGEAGFSALLSFQLRQQHIRGANFVVAVKKEIVVSRVWTLCLDVVRCCAECTCTYTHCRGVCPLLHYSVRQRKGLCRKIGAPFVRDKGLEDVPELDRSKFRPRTVDMAGPRNCF